MTTIEICTIIIAICTVVYTFGTLLLWLTSKNQIQLIHEEIQNQLAVNSSSSSHNIIDGHRDLFLEILKNDDLLDIYSKGTDSTKEQVREKYLGTLLINHALRIFKDHNYKIPDSKEFVNYHHDLTNLFQLPFVRDRWPEVRQYHPAKFRAYVENKIMS